MVLRMYVNKFDLHIFDIIEPVDQSIYFKPNESGRAIILWLFITF